MPFIIAFQAYLLGILSLVHAQVQSAKGDIHPNLVLPQAK